MLLYGTLDEIRPRIQNQPLLMQGLDYIAKFDPGYLEGREEGFCERVEIAGDDLFVMHQVYATKPVAEARYETHQRYIDIQVVWSGEESIGVTPAQGLKAIVPYDAEKDIEFFEYFPAEELILKPGYIVVLKPEDAHAPGLDHKKQHIVAKTVVKVSFNNSRL